MRVLCDQRGRVLELKRDASNAVLFANEDGLIEQARRVSENEDNW
jgi:hypothetical protein